MKESQIMICECHSYEHQAHFWYDEDDNLLFIEIHLTTHRNVFKRILYAFKYIFGHKSRFGAWDEFLMSENNRDSLKLFLINLKAENDTMKER